MESIRKQASKLREQVAKQQQAVLRQFSGRFGNDSVIADEAELQCHQQLKRLYGSTRAAKHFQRHLVRGVEGLISVSSKQMEIVTKLSDDSCKYGNENQSDGSALARASLQFGTSHNMMEKERENLHRILAAQVSEPLRTMIVGAPLDDARHLFHRYEHIRQEVEAQAAEFIRRQLKFKEAGATGDGKIKLQNAESKLSDLRSSLTALGRETTAAMMSVEAQQQRLTFQLLLAMVNAERSYHQSVSTILDELHAEMVLEKQHSESASQSATIVTDMYLPTAHEKNTSNEPGDLGTDTQKSTISTEPGDLGTDTLKPTVSTEPGDLSTNTQKSPISNEPCDLGTDTQKSTFFIAKVIHSFDAQADGELSLSDGDYVVVRQVASNGWSEGECKGKAGWFPSAYIEQRERAPASQFTEANPLP
ncbi:SH3 domain-containing protein 2-like isoform X2 [Magnolia sinica]|uniref:SH3 domain-containing protein 2-like isoform X2 n=1 Tax=Magnolia sinica TaxID=86752 RepID=UPI00265872AD|nr:SH3 domain-containing protein 2-like isoform X2 [Magnolia sinica]